MKTLFSLIIGFAMLAFGPALADEYKVGAIKIEAPWIRATPNGARVAGGFMKLENTGKEADRLVGGSVGFAEKLEVHEMSMIDNVMKMHELEQGLELKPGQSIELRPGSYHVMFMGLKEQLKEGGKVKGSLVFEKAGKIDIEYEIKGIGSMGTGGGHHH